MSCKEISENVNFSTTLLKEVKTQNFRNFIIIIVLAIALVFETCYIFYDRYLDSQFEIDAATPTEIIQDGEGRNS